VLADVPLPPQQVPVLFVSSLVLVVVSSLQQPSICLLRGCVGFEPAPTGASRVVPSIRDSY